MLSANDGQGQNDGQWQNNRRFRPAPSAHVQPGSFQSNASTQSTKRPGWNLQWRKSPSIASEQARQISDAAFDEPAPPTSIVAADGTIPAPEGLRSASPGLPQTAPHRFSAANQVPANQVPASQRVSNQLREAAQTPVRQVAWLNQNTPSGGMSIPDNLFRDSTATPPLATPEAIPPGSRFSLPQAGQGNAAVQELPAPDLTVPKQIPNELSELFEIDPPTQPNAAPELNAPPEPPMQPPSEDSSIRDMIQGEPAPNSEVLPSENTSPSERDSISDELDMLDSPSDRDTFAPNPFGDDDKQRAEDRKSREEARERRQKEDDNRPSFFDNDDGPASSGTGLSCDDFRNRIESSTIDKLSLDISPPFRPDVIDEGEFQKLKSKFIDKQESRVWRSIDGREIATGRLRDLAYEKAIIVTDFGTEEELQLNRIAEADLAYISENWGLPTECLIDQVAYTPRSWTPTTMTYLASNLCHKPAYFEEVNLERYGHTTGPFCQPIISSAHFFFNIAVLPYKMGVHSPHECQYALGYYRPGNCAPWIIPPVPLSVKGAWYQAAAITGTALLVP